MALRAFVLLLCRCKPIRDRAADSGSAVFPRSSLGHYGSVFLDRMALAFFNAILPYDYSSRSPDTQTHNRGFQVLNLFFLFFVDSGVFFLNKQQGFQILQLQML